MTAAATHRDQRRCRNAGDREAEEVVQLYVRDLAAQRHAAGA